MMNPTLQLIGLEHDETCSVAFGLDTIKTESLVLVPRISTSTFIFQNEVVSGQSVDPPIDLLQKFPVDSPRSEGFFYNVVYTLRTHRR
jgi:hypothetical protein